jgi:hypothetical protein
VVEPKRPVDGAALVFVLPLCALAEMKIQTLCCLTINHPQAQNLEL